MKRRPAYHGRLAVLGAAMAVLLAISLACAGADDTATPAAPAQPVPAMAPTVAPAMVPTLAPGAPTPIPAQATPTRVLPTATPVAMEKIQYGGNLRYAYGLSVSTLDTHYSKELADRDVYYALYSNLVQYGTDFSINPELAKSWTVSADGKAITFNLQQGVKFHNGEDFNASAVKWNFDRLLRTDDPVRLHSTAAFALESVSVVDNDTVTFNMKFPYRPLLSDLGERPGFLLAPNAVEELGGGYAADGGDFTRAGVGTGAFQFVEWIPSRHLILERFDGYWDKGKPYLDKITFLDVPDSQVQLAMLRTGEVEVIAGVRALDVPILEANPNTKVVSKVTGRWNGLRMSIDREPWSNRDVRMAIGRAIDRDTLASTYYNGAAVPAFSSEGNSWAFDPSIMLYEYDIAKAKELLADAGFPNGIDMPLWCSSTASSIELCEVYQAMLGEAGINIDIRVVPSSDSWAMALRRETHFATTSWRARADPHGRLFRIYHKDGPSNIPKFDNPTVTGLLDDAVTKYDPAEAIPLYFDAQRIIAEFGQHIYTVFPLWYAGISSNVQNFELFPDQIQRLRFIWLEK